MKRALINCGPIILNLYLGYFSNDIFACVLTVEIRFDEC